MIDEIKELMEAVIPPEWRSPEWDRSFEEWRDYLNSDSDPA